MEQHAHDPDQKLAERYFLGELTIAEAEAFEAHYFECTRCAEYVVEEQMMLDAGRSVAMEAPPVVQIADAKRRRVQWLPAAAAAMLVFVIMAPFAFRKTPEPSPRITPVHLVELDGGFRDGAAPSDAISDEHSIVVRVEIVPPESGTVALVVSDANAKVVARAPLDPDALKNINELALGVLPAGTYTVDIVHVDGNQRVTTATRKIKIVRGPR